MEGRHHSEALRLFVHLASKQPHCIHTKPPECIDMIRRTS